jgi:hypothetical protein
VRLAASLALLICSVSSTGPAASARQTAAPEQPYNRLLFAGDVMLSRAVRRQMLAADDPALPFRKMAPLLSEADISFANLESPFSDRGPYYEQGLIFHAAPEAIAGLQLAGFPVLSTANNHSRDCGPHHSAPVNRSR